MPLQKHQKVFGIGLSRTGTTSLTEALNILGVKTIHYPRDQTTYEELTKGIYNLSIFKDYQGLTDITVAPFYAQFDKVLPDCKFILTIREKNSWLKSIKNHSNGYKTSDEFGKFIRATVYGLIEFNHDRFLYAYETHIKNVTDYFKNRPNDLLIMNIVGGDEWTKLCAFLGLPIPTVAFPHMSKQSSDIEAWINELELTSRELSKFIPPGVNYILIDDNKLGYNIAPKRRAIPFLEKEGFYNGLPSDDETAIREFKRLRHAGSSFIVVAWTSFWWLDYYSGFHEYLRSKFKCVLNNERLIIFDLHTLNS